MKLLSIQPEDLTERDVKLLVKASLRAYDALEPAKLVRDALDGRLFFWRVVGEAHGVVATRVLGKVLWIEAIACPGILPHLELFLARLEILAQKALCNKIQTYASLPSVIKLYKERLGLEPVAVLFEKEVLP